MNDVQLVEALFRYVREYGNLVQKPKGSLGGIWSADTWELEGVQALLADDGSTNIFRADGISAATTYGRPVVFSEGGDRQWLEWHAKQFDIDYN